MSYNIIKKPHGLTVSQAKVGELTYMVQILGAGYNVVYTRDGSNFVVIGGGFRDGSQAERKAKAYHKVTFGTIWPKSAKFQRLI